MFVVTRSQARHGRVGCKTQRGPPSPVCTPVAARHVVLALRADSARAAGTEPPAEGTPSVAALRAALARSEAALRRASERRDALYAQFDTRVLLPAWLDDFLRPGLAAYFGAPLPRVCATLAGGLGGAPVVANRLTPGNESYIKVHALNYVWRGAARTLEHWYTLDCTSIYAMARGESTCLGATSQTGWASSAEVAGNAVVNAAEDLKRLRGGRKGARRAGAEARVLEVLGELPDEQLWLPALVLSAFDFPYGSEWWEPPSELFTGKRRRAQTSSLPKPEESESDEEE